MGSQHSKHRIAASKSGVDSQRGDPASRWGDMEGPSFHCQYLGFVALSKPPTGLAVLQAPVKDLYLKYRKSTAGSNSASLKLTQQGVFVLLFEDGAAKQELFLSFESVNLVDAVKFHAVRTSNEKKPKAIFLSIDEGKPPLPEKHAFSLDKNVLFLATASHPPLVVCVVRRPQGVKALDCHVFALDTIENSIHIAGLISSTQIPADSTMGRGSFDRRGNNDVIRTEYGDYSIYRGPASYDQGGRGPLNYDPNVRGPLNYDQNVRVPSNYDPNVRGPSNYDPNVRGPSVYDQGPPPGGQSPFYPGPNNVVGGPSRNDFNAPGMAGPSHQNVATGPHMLTQDDFLRPQQAPQHVEQEPPAAKTPFSPENIGAFRYDVSGPDLLRGRQVSVESTEDTKSYGSGSGPEVVMRNDNSINYARNSGQRFSTEDQSVRNNHQRYSDENTNQRVTSHRLSSGQGPPVAAKPFSPRMSVDHSTAPRYPSGVQQPNPDLINSQQHVVSSRSPRSSVVIPPTSPRGINPTPDEYFSASNLESRGDEDVPEAGPAAHKGRPVAKVPPHMKGIKVLPSDFMMVKLKPKEDRKTESFDDDSGYDNNKDIMDKYRELQEQTRDTFSNKHGSANPHPDPSLHNNFPDGRDFRDFGEPSVGSHGSQDVHSYTSNWLESGNGQRRESNNNKAAHGGADPVTARHNNTTPSNNTTPYNSNTNHPQNPNNAKDAEIANMFSDFSMHGGGKGNPLHRQQRNDFEDGLGYLP